MLMTILLFLTAFSTPAAGQQPSDEELAKQFAKGTSIAKALGSGITVYTNLTPIRGFC